MSKNKVVSIEQFSSHPGVPRLLSKSDADQRGRPSRESPSSGDCGLAPAPGPPGGTPESAIQVAAPTETRNAQLAPSKYAQSRVRMEGWRQIGGESSRRGLRQTRR